MCYYTIILYSKTYRDTNPYTYMYVYVYSKTNAKLISFIITYIK